MRIHCPIDIFAWLVFVLTVALLACFIFGLCDAFWPVIAAILLCALGMAATAYRWGYMHRAIEDYRHDH